jgi:small nuclear ribonucleoprotein
MVPILKGLPPPRKGDEFIRVISNSYQLLIGDNQMAGVKPLSILNNCLKKRVIVELRFKRGYCGILDGFDPHLNLVLKNVEEYEENEIKRKLNTAIVRGDNVVYISP